MGDKEFKQYMEENGGNSSENNSDGLPFYMILCVREKSKTLIELFKESLNFYEKMMKEKPLVVDEVTKGMKEYIKKLSEESLCTLQQFDMIMIDSEPYEDDETGPDDLINPKGENL